jgi:hypothetical protein
MSRELDGPLELPSPEGLEPGCFRGARFMSKYTPHLAGLLNPNVDQAQEGLACAFEAEMLCYLD